MNDDDDEPCHAGHIAALKSDFYIDWPIYYDININIIIRGIKKNDLFFLIKRYNTFSWRVLSSKGEHGIIPEQCLVRVT